MNVPQIYLSFDDGPSDGCTEDVLKILDRNNAKATFFCIANKAVLKPNMLLAIKRNGHSIGNHSLDHKYSSFYKNTASIKNWITNAEDLFHSILGHHTIGFRSPAGVVTPPLVNALTEMKMPLILWDLRFFDKCFSWKENSIKQSLKKVSPGSIVLLHDTHYGNRKKTFIKTLELFISHFQQRGYRFESIPYNLTKQHQ
ncbi:MAG: polysaccharide deacetylase family protein [Oligoflexia bacterium]|nr:polysaccharide deacetylase family protein [Oligoflexia bacterium]